MSGPRGIDHVVLPVHDLDAGAESWERLGFTLTPAARHPWGTCNRLVQFDGAFLEILAVDRPALIPDPTPGRFSFGAFNRDFLARREGASMLVLESGDSDRDIAEYGALGLTTFERFDFERAATGPGGEVRTVAFSLAFAMPGPATSASPSEAGFFTCRQHFPENFWRPAYQRHANGAVGIAAVTLTARDPADHHAFLSAFVGTRTLHMTGYGLEIATPRGAIEVLTPQGFHFRYGLEPPLGGSEALSIAALRIAVRDLEAARGHLHASALAPMEHAGTLVVPAAALHGVTVAFEPASGAG
ncbi:VOC family protein [Prosthecomicrobium sp. N25]|uniref:VOC family protein n=1 Tax=Prosthecomicrobium sp. N25 TaxID=3129254 RepID=UPI003077A908